MSHQQINLYQPMFRKQRRLFSAVAMAQGSGLVLLGLLLFHGIAAWQTHTLEAQCRQWKTHRSEALARVEQVRKLFPESPPDRALQEELNRVRTVVEARQRIAAHLATGEAGNLQGFSARLEGLARQKAANLWLTEVAFRRGGAELVLRGSTMQPEQVPRYLGRLGQELAFAGVEFSHLQIARPGVGSLPYDFVVSTVPWEEKDKETTP